MAEPFTLACLFLRKSCGPARRRAAAFKRQRGYDELDGAPSITTHKSVMSKCQHGSKAGITKGERGETPRELAVRLMTSA